MNRRTFVRRVAVAGAVRLGLAGWGPGQALAEPPPEMTKLRLAQIPGTCVAPQYIAGDLLQAEGFTNVQYVSIDDTNTYAAYGRGDVDLSMAFVAPFLVQVDAGLPIVLLAGVHVGCFEVMANGTIRAIRDLKGKRVGIPGFGTSHHLFLSTMLAYIGLDPRKDVEWVTHKTADSADLLASGKLDALIGFAPVPQELRAKKIGHVIVNSAIDRPWSQYFCCMIAANKEFVRRNPVATRRAMRAILKATDVCALEPDRAARTIVDRGFTKAYDYAFTALKEIPYNRWRAYDPEDTVRFYSLRLREVGMVKGNAQKLIVDGTDWRLLNELKKELKG
jgi:NitT/TauT family transport system substrate-binding protein